MTIIIKNTSGGDLELEDFGIDLIASAQRTLSNDFGIQEICGSAELKTLVTAGDITINDGTSDLSTTDGIAAITIETKREDEANDSSGGGWTVSSTAPSSPSDGDGWFNTSDGVLYVYDDTRSKWLSSPVVVTLNSSGQLKTSYAALGDNYSGLIKFPFDMTLLSLSLVITSSTSGFGFQYEVDGSSAYSNSSDANGEFFVDGLNIDLDAGSEGAFYFTGTSPSASGASIFLTYARRGT